MSEVELLTAKLAAAFLGITEQALYQNVAKGWLPRPVYPAARAPRWIKSELIAALEQSRARPSDNLARRRAARLAAARQAAAALENDPAAD